MRPHESLDVWKTAVELVVNIYKLTETFPKEEKFGLTSQIRRAAVSIPTNIAEGAARTSPKEFMYFLSNAQGSASEVETELLIAQRLGYFGGDEHTKMRSAAEDIGRMLTGLRNYLKHKEP